FRTPDSGYICRIIPDLLNITHEFNQVPLWVPEVLKLVLAGAMSSGAIEQHIAVLHEMFSLPCQVGEIHHLEGKVMHTDIACLCECQAMMIRIAAHPEEDIFYPVRDAETQHLAIKLGGALAIVYRQGDVTKLSRLDRTRPIGGCNLHHTSD